MANLRKHFLLAFIFLMSINLNAQSANKIYKNKSINTQNSIAKEHIIFDIDVDETKSILYAKESKLQVTIPFFNGKDILLDLEANNIFAEDFSVIEKRSDGVFEIDYEKGMHYKGKVANDNESLVAVSLFENEIAGVIITDGKTYNIGAINDPLIRNKDNQIVLYPAENLKNHIHNYCSVEEETNDLNIKDGNEAVNRSSPGDVEVYFECDYQMYLDNASSAGNTTNYVTSMYNVVATIYNNESIPSIISQVFVWTIIDGYDQTNSSTALNDFQATVGSGFNGNLAHLLSTGNFGNGGRAFIDVLCNKNSAHAYSNINGSFNTFPTYSWDVYVVAHEMGHNMGSPHTHSCSWNNNNTQIDDCGSVYFLTNNNDDDGDGAIDELDEAEPCYNPSNVIIPSNGGTIMSYCHLNTVNINFNLNFGTQPGNLIRNRYNSCLCDNVNLYCQSSGSLNVNTNSVSVSNYQVGNNGTSSAVASTLGYYLSSNTTISTSDYLAGTDYVAALGNSGVSTESITITPSNINTMPPDGSYYVGMLIDYQDVVDESNESDNNDCYFTSPQVIIGCTNSNAHNYNPNANFDNNNCETCTDSVQNGDETGVDCGGNLCSPCGSNLFCQSSGALNVSPNSINISGIVVSNSGATPPSVSYLGYYLSLNTIISTGDYLIGTDFVPALSDGSTSVESIVVTPSNIINLPPEGNYYVGMLVDYQNAISETNENDNNDCYFTTPQVIVGCMDANAHNYNPNATFDSGACQTCSDGVQNGDETGVDCGGVLCSPCSSNIDLLVSNCGIIDVSGDVITISGVQITNNGNVASGVSELGYYLSTNSIISTGDILIGTDYVTSLGVGGVSNESITVDISTLGLTIPSGSYYIGLLVDHLGAVTETNETNNNDCYDTTDRYHSTTVTNVNASGFGSLDQAIICANTRVGADIIDFAISGSGVFTISPTSAITYVTDDNTIIDATTQPNWYLGQIVLDGSNATNAYGIVNNGSDNFELYGLKIQNFDYAGIWTKGDSTIIGDTGKGNVSVSNNFGLYIRESTNAQIYDNYFGVLENNVTAAGNDYHGIRAIGLTNCTIGKSGAGNTIGANNYAGIGIGDYNYTDSDYSIRYNYIGTSSADVDLGNKRSGIDKQPTVTVTDIDIWNNTIAYNDIYGVWVYDAQCTFWDPYYNAYYCNTSGGLRIETGSNNSIVSPTITNATTSIIEGTAQAGALVEVRYRDTDCTTMPCQAKTLIGFDTADSNGNWSVTGVFTSGTFVLANQGVNTTDWTTSAFSTCRLIDDCPANLYLSADYNGTLDLEVWNIITADNTILSGADVTYDADDCIELNAGFEVEQGAVFEAKIDGCGGSFDAETDQK